MAAQTLFRDRVAAGVALADALAAHATRNVVVLALPRGGVPVGRVVADALHAPFDVMVARKLGVPGLNEVALGAVAEGWNGIAEDSVRWFIGIPRDVVARIVERERREVARRVQTYRGGRPLPDVKGKTVILVDDGLATGATLRAAAMALRQRRPLRLIAAVPVASLTHCDETRAVVDELVTLATPDPFEMVSTWYDDFSAVSDADVMRLLQRTPMTVEAGPQTDAIEEHEVSIPVDDTDGRTIIGDLGTPNEPPTEPRGLVILAHGGGSSRQSYRNRYLAGRLRMAGWSSLRVDLLTETEQAEDASTAALRFDVPFIARRLRTATEWVAANSAPGANRLVLFGASTGAAAAMMTAAERPDLVFAVASRGGRVDLAGDALTRVVSPVLLVVGGADGPTIEWNRAAAQRLPRRPELVIVRDAGHTFEEPGALGEVGERVVRWLNGLNRDAIRPRWLRALSRR